jgi:leader peptidase (prepilin peptidase)/N-methyltransferase
MGACFGSLLNVIVVRLPIMLIKDNNFGLNLNLMYPRSMCMSCKNRLRLWQNIPLISYLILRGKCFYCENKFGIKYFIIELLTAISFMLVAYYNNDLLIILAQCCFIFFVVAITLIDFKYFIIPDELSLSMLWLGLIFNINGLLVNDVKSSILGAVLGYIFFYLLASVYRLLTKKEGIGQGDFKLFAAILAWIGVDMFIPMLLLAPLLAIIYFIIIKLLKNVSFNEEIPFGPFLSIAGLFIMFNMKYILNLLY